MFNRERQIEHFKNHVASLKDYGDIKVLDFKNPESINYRIRFIFEEDWCRCHISGDLGELVATNYNNMTFEGFKDFVHNTGYFKGKIDCASRPIYEYDEELAVKELDERLADVEFDSFCDETQDELREEKIQEIMDDFNSRSGLGSKAYELLNEYDPDCFEYFDSIGRKDTEILELYMLAFELATEQLKEKAND